MGLRSSETRVSIASCCLLSSASCPGSVHNLHPASYLASRYSKLSLLPSSRPSTPAGRPSVLSRMLNVLARIFQASPDRDSEHDHASMESGPEDVESQRRAVSITDDSGLGLETAESERRPSMDATAIMDARRRAPSHVSWKTPRTNANPSPSIIEPSWGSQYESHSASAPSLLLLNSNTAAKASSMHRQSSQSLRIPSVSTSQQWSQRNSPEKKESAELYPARHVPPLDPRLRLPSVSVRRPSTDSMPLTPDSTRVHDGREYSYCVACLNIVTDIP